MINLDSNHMINFECLEGKVAFIGDLHLNYVTPKSRIDDYPSVCLNKLKQIREKCIANNIKHIVFLGDIVHKPQQSLDYLFRIVEEFREFKRAGITCYTIIGNHDYSTNQINYLNKSALGIMLEAGLIHPFHNIGITTTDCAYEVNTYIIRGINYGEGLEPVGDNNCLSIMVAHMFFDNPHMDDKENLTKAQAIDLGYDYYVLGHDHMPYKPLYLQNSDSKMVGVFRPGSITRGTSHKYNQLRDIKFLVGTFSRGKVQFDYILLSVAPSEAVFATNVMEQTQEKKTLAEAEFTKLIEVISEEVTGDFSSVYSVIDTVQMDERVKTRIIQYLEDAGIYRECSNNG